MPKNSLPIGIDSRHARPKSRRRRTLFKVIFLVVIALPVWEGLVVFYAQWCDVMGTSAKVRTPIIDAISSGLAIGRDHFMEDLGPSFNSCLRDPMVALPVAAVFLVVAMAMLKR
jgi:hypothetical protein